MNNFLKGFVVIILALSFLKMAEGLIIPKVKNTYLDLFYNKSKIETFMNIDTKELNVLSKSKSKIEKTMFGDKTISNNIELNGFSFDKNYIEDIKQDKQRLINASKEFDNNLDEIESFIGLIAMGVLLFPFIMSSF